MDLDNDFSLEHLLFVERKCRTCGKTKDLVDGFYRTRKDKGPVPSSYSYECKECTIQRNKGYRRSSRAFERGWEYPDW